MAASEEVKPLAGHGEEGAEEGAANDDAAEQPSRWKGRKLKAA